MRVIILCSLLFLAACTESSKLSLNLKHLVKTSSQQPGGDCKKLGEVSGFTLQNQGFTRSYEKALNSVLEETHNMGGNFVFIKRVSLDGTNLMGISYACN